MFLSSMFPHTDFNKINLDWILRKLKQHEDDIDALEAAEIDTDALESAIAIVSDGDTHGSIIQGEYVYIRNHTSFSEGLYKATQTIGANSPLTASNVTAVSSGGLNQTVAIAKGGTGEITVENAKTAFGLANITTMPFTIAANSTAYLTFSTNNDFILFVNGTNYTRRGIFMGGSTGAGVVTVSEVWRGTSPVISVAVSGSDPHVIEVTNTGTVGVFCLFIMHNTMNTNSLPDLT